MKILILLRKLVYGGAERQVVNLCKGLAARGHTIRVAVFYPGSAMVEELDKAGVPITSLGKRSRWDVSGFFHRWIDTIRVQRADIIYSVLESECLLSIAARVFAPHSAIVWRLSSSDLDIYECSLLYKLICRLLYGLARYTDATIANSFAGRDYVLTRGLCEDRVKVVSNGIDTDHFMPAPMSGDKVRAEWKVSRTVQLVGLVGRIDPIKNHASLIRASHILFRRGLNIKLVFVGEGKDAQVKALQSLSESMGMGSIIVWAGVRSDMVAVYNAIDVLCLPSLSEGFSNVLCEAMACGVRCVATDVGDAARILNGMGALVEPNSDHSLADGIERTIKTVSCNDEVRLHIVRNYGINLMIDHTERVFAEALVARKRAGK